jgi:hypothetical protein
MILLFVPSYLTDSVGQYLKEDTNSFFGQNTVGVAELDEMHVQRAHFVAPIAFWTGDLQCVEMAEVAVGK